MKGEDELILASMRLRAMAPREWDEFVATMRKIAAIKAAELVRAELAQLQMAQGFARAYEEIATALHRAPENYEKAQANGRPQAQPRA